MAGSFRVCSAKCLRAVAWDVAAHGEGWVLDAPDEAGFLRLVIAEIMERIREIGEKP